MDFLSIGHVCHDTAPSGFIPGGAVTYSGLFAQQLGMETGVLTSVGDDFLFRHLFKNIQFESFPSEQTTVFQNKYFEGHRKQYLLARANDIKPAHLPEHWKNARMAFIGPIADEVDFGFLDIFENALICVNPQGWMRSWDDSGKVSSKPFKNYNLLAKAELTIISEEDVGMDNGIINEMAQALKILVVTKGEAGCDVYFKKEKTSFPAFKTLAIDRTGAGDAFSTAFLIYYYETRDLFKAAQYANVAASFCIEAEGISMLPNRKQIATRFETYLNMF